MLKYRMNLETVPVVDVAAEKLEALDVKAVIFDLDDTLIYMSDIFGSQMWSYAEAVAAELGMDQKSVYETLSEINDEEYKTMGVSPERWESVVSKLAETLGDETGIVEEMKTILYEIYEIEPRLKPGAKAILDGLQKAGMKIGLVTHANEEWTFRKLEQTGLWDYFDQIVIANENGHKGKQHYSRAMELLEVPPEQCLVTGDNLNGDIVPSAELGARTIWMPSPWSVYREEVVPNGTVQIGELSEWWDGLLRLE